MAASSATATELEAQLPLEPLPVEVAEDGRHDGHEPASSRGLAVVVEADCTAEAAPLLQDEWGLLDSLFEECGGTHEDCAVVVEVEVEAEVVEDALACIVVIQSSLSSNCWGCW